MATVDICLATFNGAGWLADFLASLDRQHFTDWRLVVSDDGSTDGTVTVLESHFRRDPSRLLLVSRPRTRAGLVANFQDTLAASTADYVFPADQDDIWLPHKLGDMVTAIRSLERSSDGPALRPALIYSDMRVVDEMLRPLDASWWAYSGVPADWVTELRHLVVQNNVPGCAMVVNRALLQVALPIPPLALMHDVWLLLVCLMNGQVGHVQSATTLYRRHQGAATIGGRRDWKGRLRRFVLDASEVREHFQATASQTAALVDRTGNQTKPEYRRLLREYTRAGNSGWLMRRWLLLKLRIRKATAIGTLRLYLFV